MSKMKRTEKVHEKIMAKLFQIWWQYEFTDPIRWTQRIGKEQEEEKEKKNCTKEHYNQITKNQ
jgi:23S rRNA maturation mini-RNase III